MCVVFVLIFKKKIKTKTKVPVNYRCTLDGSGQRRDKMDRFELHKGSVDYIPPLKLANDWKRVRYHKKKQYTFVRDTKYEYIKIICNIMIK